MPTSILFVFVAIGLMGFVCQWIAWRTQLPAILYLLLTGVLVGPVFNVLDPDALFGDLFGGDSARYTDQGSNPIVVRTAARNGHDPAIREIGDTRADTGRDRGQPSEAGRGSPGRLRRGCDGRDG